MKIVISAESTIDLTSELLNKYNIHTTPFTITLGDKTALDGEITSKEIIDFVKKTEVLPKTSAVNSFQYEEHFNKLLENYDAIIHFSLSSEMSSACNNAKLAAEEFDNVYVVDTRSLSTGIALLAIYASKLITKGLDVKDIYNKVLQRVPANQTSFVLSRLDYLYKGGRCSGLSYLAATLLKIRPQIVVKDGAMVPKKKYVGKYDRCISKYVDDVLKEWNTPDLDEVFITYTTADDKDVEKVKETLKEKGFKNIHVTTAGGTITSHCGENCLGILYLNDGDSNGIYNK